MFPVIDWHLVSLELLITTILVGLVILDVVLPRNDSNDVMGKISVAGLLGLIVFWVTQDQLVGVTFNNMFVMDHLAWFFKGFFLLTMVFVFLMTQEFFKPIGGRRNEFYLLLWLALLGMCFMASSADFLVLFISMEILTISLYVMTAYLKSDQHSLEAGMKYLILGALTSGCFLFGLSFIYGTTHTTNFALIQQFVSVHAPSPMILLGMVLVFAAVGFKIASVPFQLWVPDVYQGAPTPVTALLSVGSKAAGFVLLIRIFLGAFAGWHMEWGVMFAALSAVTMCYGNLAALHQTNIKRLLGYSSIGHAGYLLMGAAAGSVLGLSGINFYLLGYLFTNLAAFMVIVCVFMNTKSDAIEDYAGLSKRSPFLAAGLLLALVSLAGIPPLVGFFGKFTLLLASVKSGFVWLALVAAVNIVISMYYYLRIAKTIYVDQPKSNSLISVPPMMHLAISLTMIAIIAFGLFQGPVFQAALIAAKN